MQPTPHPVQSHLPALRLAVEAMATRFELAFFGSDRVRLRAAGEAALAEVTLWHRRLSFFEPSSDISRINREAARHAVPCDQDLFELLSLARDISLASRGAFDPTIASAMKAAGFRGTNPEESADRAHVLACTGMDKVALDPQRRTIRFTAEGVGLDLGAIGKGWALDRAGLVLQECGVKSALIHGGTSSVLAMNTGETGPESFAVKIGKEPDAPVVLLRNAALGCSAPHGRILDGAGHVIDPRSGLSARGLLLAAVVAERAPNAAALADAWSTALLVLGRPPASTPAGLRFIERPAPQQPR